MLKIARKVITADDSESWRFGDENKNLHSSYRPAARNY